MRALMMGRTATMMTMMMTGSKRRKSGRNRGDKDPIEIEFEEYLASMKSPAPFASSTQAKSESPSTSPGAKKQRVVSVLKSPCKTPKRSPSKSSVAKKQSHWCNQIPQ